MHPKEIAAREKFLFTLDWLLEVIKRYPGPISFGLVCINFGSYQTLGETFGAQVAASKLVDVSDTLRKFFRKTDLVARDGLDFWVLVPYTPANEKLTDKIKAVIELASQSGLDIVERDISVFSLPLDGVDAKQNLTALELLHLLKGKGSSHAQTKVSLPAV